MNSQLNSMYKYLYNQIWNIGRICKYINDAKCMTFVQALIKSRMYYDTALLHDRSFSLFDKQSTACDW